MSGAVELRPACPADAAPIARVHVETWRNAYAGVVPKAYLLAMTEAKQAAQWASLIRRRTGPEAGPEAVLVAEASRPRGRQVVGFGNCGRSRGAPSRGEIFTLYVAGDWQGRGIGRRLLHRCFATLHAGGLDSALVWVLSANPARFFYEAMDGQRAAERRESFAGVMLEETAYAWPDLAAWLAARADKGSN